MAGKSRLPPHNQTTVNTARARIVNTTMPYVGKSYVAEEFAKFADDLALVLPKADPNVVFESIKTWAGVVLTPVMVGELSWRLAGNLRDLNSGKPVYTWTQQLKPEWCPMQVINVTKRMTRRRLDVNSVEYRSVPVADLEIFILGGSPAGRTITKQFVQHDLLSPTRRYAFGMTRWDKSRYKRNANQIEHYTIVDVRELTKFRFYGYVTPELSSYAPDFYEIDGSQTFKKLNRQLVVYRRRDVFECPMEYDPAARPCYMCEQGYDKCALGCHATTYTQQPCTKCEEEGAYFNLQLNTNRCVDCVGKYTDE